jgi:transcriptional regulator with XRE-family HTH domain
MTPAAARERALELRTNEGLSARRIGERIGVPQRTVARWVHGVPVPAWTKRPNAKDGLRERALALRAAGWSVPDLARELGVARSTAWLWVRDQPLDASAERVVAGAERRRQAVREFWAGRNEATDAQRQEVQADAAARVGAVSDAELLRVGALIYWCEGAKAKPWSGTSEYVAFTNSDPGLIALLPAFLRASGVSAERLRFRLSIHDRRCRCGHPVVGELRGSRGRVVPEDDAQAAQAVDGAAQHRRGLSRLPDRHGPEEPPVVLANRRDGDGDRRRVQPVSASTAAREFDTLARSDRP